MRAGAGRAASSGVGERVVVGDDEGNRCVALVVEADDGIVNLVLDLDTFQGASRPTPVPPPRRPFAATVLPALPDRLRQALEPQGRFLPHRRRR